MNNDTFYLVVGLGKTGLSIARYMRNRDFPFVVFDTRKAPNNLDSFKLEFPDTEVILADLPESIYKKLKAIVSSPGVSLDEPFMQKACEMGIPIIGDIELLACEIDKPVVAITGTNGKSTVTTLVGEMAKKAGINVAVAGNIGTPVLDLLVDNNQYELWVLELSSFQLDLIHSLKPRTSVLLNISTDHLDRHHTMSAYVESKHKIFKRAKTLIYNRHDAKTTPNNEDRQSSVEQISFGLDEPCGLSWGIVATEDGLCLARGQEILLPVNNILVKGSHNWANALASCAAALSLGIDYSVMIDVLQTFTGLPHRGQLVKSVDGVDWINDSKGTNVGATCAAISGIGNSIRGKIVLIAGGQGKGADFSEMQVHLNEYVRSLVLIGEDADIIEKSLLEINISRASTLEQAVTIAKEKALPGDVVLLSPACASFDMFVDFNHRGNVFVEAVNAI